MNVASTHFGHTPQGIAVHRFTIRNNAGLCLSMINYGATIVSLEVPDRSGKLGDVVLGFDSLDTYLNHRGSFGCTVGRFANRIAHGRFSLNGRQVQLPINWRDHHLHGGPGGFMKQVWQAEEEHRPDQKPAAAGVRFSYMSRDGDQGYPGDLTAHATYLLTEDNRLVMEFSAITNRPTIVNLTNHAYWNLSGRRENTILGHQVMIASNEYVEVTQDAIPTGRLVEVDGTRFDFRLPVRLGDRMSLLAPTGTDRLGYDHCYALDQLAAPDRSPRECARVVHPASGRMMTVSTTQPGVQFYTANNLTGTSETGGFNPFAGLCLETQHWPDAPNHGHFPSTVLLPGEQYRETAIYAFGCC